VRCSGGLGDLGVAFPARSYHAEQVPGHSAFPLDCSFCIVRFLRIQYGVRNKSHQGDKWVDASGHAGEGGGESVSFLSSAIIILCCHPPQVRRAGQ